MQVKLRLEDPRAWVKYTGINGQWLYFEKEWFVYDNAHYQVLFDKTCLDFKDVPEELLPKKIEPAKVAITPKVATS